MRRKGLAPASLLGVGLLVALACGGGTPVAAPAAAPPQPQQPVQPALAAPAPEPQAPASAPRPPGAGAAPVARPAPPPGQEPKYGGILVLANRGDPPGAFETLRISSSELHHVSGGLNGNGNLVKPCRANVFEVCPGVAEKWEHNADYTQWTFKVRDNILWHDGTRFTAEDAKFWLELVAFGAQGGGKSRGPAYFSANFGEAKKIEVLEGNRVRVSLGKPSLQYLHSIYSGDASIGHPRHLMQARIEKGDVNVTPQDVEWVSIGPYKMHKFEKGTVVQTRRFERYWEKDEKGRQLPYLEGIDFAIIRDPAAMDAAFRVGRLDGGGLGTGHFLTMERKAGYIRDLGDKVWFAEIPATRQNLSFNVLKPGPLQDVRVRRAISLWIDREAAIVSGLGGFGQLYAMLAPQNPYTSPDFATWPGWNKATKERDRAEAKRLLAEAGYPNGFPMTLLLRRTWVADRGEFLAGQLKGLNIDLKLVARDDAGEASGRLTLDFDSYIGGGVAFAVIPESLEAGYTRYSLSKPGAVKHEDPKVSDLFARIRTTPDTQQRIKLWRELERYLLLEQAYTVSVFSNLGVIPYRSHVKGLPVSQEGVKNTTDFATTWLDK